LFTPLGASRSVAFLGHLLNAQRLSPKTTAKSLTFIGREWPALVDLTNCILADACEVQWSRSSEGANRCPTVP